MDQEILKVFVYDMWCAVVMHFSSWSAVYYSCTQRKSCLIPTLSTTNPTWTDVRWDLGWNPGHCAETMAVEASFYFQLAQIYSICNTFAFTTK